MLRRWTISYAVLLSVTGLLGSTPIYADTIAVIGTGDVAGALGPEFAAQGHTIVYGSRNPSRDDVRALGARTWPACRCHHGRYSKLYEYRTGHPG